MAGDVVGSHQKRTRRRIQFFWIAHITDVQWTMHVTWRIVRACSLELRKLQMYIKVCTWQGEFFVSLFLSCASNPVFLQLSGGEEKLRHVPHGIKFDMKRLSRVLWALKQWHDLLYKKRGMRHQSGVPWAVEGWHDLLCKKLQVNGLSGILCALKRPHDVLCMKLRQKRLVMRTVRYER